MKNNIDYFTHDSNSYQHPKFKMLRLKYGRAGEGRFRALNGMISQSEECRLDFNKPYNKATIATDLGFSLEELEEFVAFLLSENCQLLLCENGRLTTDRVSETFNKVSTSRQRNKMNYQRRVNKMSTDCQRVENKIQHVELIQSKVKESKVNKKKEYNTELEAFVGGRNSISIAKRKPLPKIKKITPKLLDIWIARRKDYSVKDIQQSTTNYCKEIISRKTDEGYGGHRFDVFTFLKQANGLEKFINYN